MKNALLLLLLLLSPPSFAELYQCKIAAKTTYQDQPCQAAQSQKIIEQQARKPSVQSSAPSNVQPNAQPNLPPVAVSNNLVLIERDAHGKIKRSEKAKADFKAANPCPANGKGAGSCPGYVIDHVKPLACGGADSPENMQWQTLTAGKEKDAWERDDCGTQAKQPARNQYPPSDTAAPIKVENQTVYTGKRGGHYVLSKTGKKHYLGHRH